MSKGTRVAVTFTAVPETIGPACIVRLPAAASQQLPSRGQVAVAGSINGHGFSTVLEPDGLRGHWLKLDEQLQDAAGISPGQLIDCAVEVTRDWPEAAVPADLAATLRDAPRDVQEVWLDITPMARWEWVRWVNATANPATRRRRVEVTISKIAHGKRRPCCFDLSACTDPAVSKSGKLIGAG
jgi:Bacteriocin-protection, YdeI or OmpD-Associated/Domain of unknown function (DUF1905)